MNPAQLRALLARRVGPLPVGAWLVIVAVGVAATAAVVRRRQGAAAPVEPADPDAPATSTMPTPFTLGGFQVPGNASPGTGQGVNPSSVDFDPPEVRTNADWEISASRWAIGRGFQPSVVTAALAKFLMGEQLTPQELSIVDQALAANGPPPEPVPPPQSTPTPTPTNNGGGSATPPPTAPVDTRVTDAQAIQLARAGRPLPAGYRISVQANGDRWLVKGAWGVLVARLTFNPTPDNQLTNLRQ
jgi:hypothetical protein